jgi:hypothetical protein
LRAAAWFGNLADHPGGAKTTSQENLDYALFMFSVVALAVFDKDSLGASLRGFPAVNGRFRKSRRAAMGGYTRKHVAPQLHDVQSCATWFHFPKRHQDLLGRDGL